MGAKHGATAMEYRGVEYAVVQTIPSGWLWSVKRVPADKVGITHSRENGVTLAKKFIDALLKKLEQPKA
jgi:hypothetical protein